MTETETTSAEFICIVPLDLNEDECVFAVIIYLVDENRSFYEVSFLLNKEDFQNSDKIKQRCRESGWDLSEEESCDLISLLNSCKFRKRPVVMFEDFLEAEFCEELNSKIMELQSLVRMVGPIWPENTKR